MWRLVVLLSLVCIVYARLVVLDDGPESRALKSLRPTTTYMTADQLPPRTRAEEDLNDVWQRLRQSFSPLGFLVSPLLEVRVREGDAESAAEVTAAQLVPESALLFQAPENTLLSRTRLLAAHPEWTPLLKHVSLDALMGLFIARVRAMVERFAPRTRAVLHKAEYAALRAYPPCRTGLLAHPTVVRALPPWLHDDVLAAQASLETEWTTLSERAQSMGIALNVSEAQWREGVCQFRSRSFLCIGDEGLRCLVPMLDWVTHSSAYNIGYQWHPDRVAFIAFALKRIFPGQALKARFGNMPMISSFMIHGFVDTAPAPTAREEGLLAEIFLPFPPIAPDDPLADTKRALMARTELTGITLGRTVRANHIVFDALGLHVARRLLVQVDDGEVAANFTHVLDEPLPQSVAERIVHLRAIDTRGALDSRVEQRLREHLRTECSTKLELLRDYFESKIKPEQVGEQAALLHAAQRLTAEMRRLLQACQMTL